MNDIKLNIGDKFKVKGLCGYPIITIDGIDAEKIHTIGFDEDGYIVRSYFTKDMFISGITSNILTIMK